MLVQKTYYFLATGKNNPNTFVKTIEIDCVVYKVNILNGKTNVYSIYLSTTRRHLFDIEMQ